MADNRAPLKPTVLDVMTNWLFADPVPGNKGRPNMRLKVLGNAVRITVATKVDEDQQKNHGKIEFRTDLETFSAAFAMLLRMAEGLDTGPGYAYDYWDDFVAGKKYDNPIKIASLVVGRDKENGKLYIAVISGDRSRPMIRFYFGPTKYHRIRRLDGTEITEAEISQHYAIGFAKPMASIIEQLMVHNFDPDAKNVSKPQQGGGGYNNNGGGNRNGGGGYNQPRNNGGYNGGGGSSSVKADASFDDDFGDF